MGKSTANRINVRWDKGQVRVRPKDFKVGLVGSKGTYPQQKQTSFELGNGTNGEIGIMSLQQQLLQMKKKGTWSTVPINKVVKLPPSGTMELRLHRYAKPGTYEYVVVFHRDAWPKKVKDGAEREHVAAGVAVAGSSPRIIVKPPPDSGSSGG